MKTMMLNQNAEHRTLNELLAFLCTSFKRLFRTERGLNQHARSCKVKTTEDDSRPIPTQVLLVTPIVEQDEKILYIWGRYRDKEFEENVSFIYEQIVYWKRNMFLLPTGKAGKQFIDEITKLINIWTDESPMKNIAIKAIMIMPSLLLQKPSKESKSKDHLKALERRMELWKSGDLIDLFEESLTIQKNLKSVQQVKTIAQISKKCSIEMQKGNVNGALKLLTNNMHGILPLNDDTISKLRMKHPKAVNPDPVVLLPDDTPNVHPIRFECITAEEVRKAAIRTKGGSGPSGLDAYGWRRIFTSKSFGECASDLCKA